MTTFPERAITKSSPGRRVRFRGTIPLPAGDNGPVLRDRDTPAAAPKALDPAT
jgi:hypothetical protein